MSRYWQKTLQDTVGKTVTGLSDGAARFKQGWADKPQTSPEPSSQSSSPRQAQASPDKDKQQYLRLPLESARKLRWYDREDLSNLVQINLKDKRLLQSTIAALRQVIQDSGVSGADLDAELKDRIEEVEKQAMFDDGVASVLLTSIQGEVATLQEQLGSQAAEIAELQRRLSEPAGDGSTGRADQPVVLQIVVRHPEASEPVAVSSHRPTPSAFESIKGDGGAELGDLHRLKSGLQAEALLVSSHSRAADEDLLRQPADDADIATSALLGKLQRVEEERREYFEEMARLNDLLRSHEHAANETRATAARLEAQLDAAVKGRAEGEEAAEAKMQDLRSRVAASQAQHAEMLRRAQDICIEAEDRAGALEKRLDKAEARAVKAEAELKDAAAEVRRLASELKGKEKERDRLEARAATSEGLLAEAKQKGEVEKGGALSAALSAARKASDDREAELRKAMRDGEEKLRQRIQKLEADNAELRRSLARGEAEAQSLEARLVDAEEAESMLHRDLRAAEAAVADRDELEAKTAALQERLEETRAMQGQLANYKQIAKELEGERARVEEEVVATVRIATSLEARLQAANTARTSAEHVASLAEKRSLEAERRVEAEVARRLEIIGLDESLWPTPAREALARQTQKLEAVHSVLSRLQNELDAEQHNLAVELAARASLQDKLTAAEERLQKLDREARDAIQKLERKVSTAKLEAEEWQRETAAAEAELARVSSLHRKAGAPLRTSSGAQASTPRRGGGALNGVVDLELMNGGSGPIDHLYLKNVMLKFIAAVTEQRVEQCHVLLPAVATLLHASPAEFKALKGIINGQGSWWPQSSTG